MTMIKINGIYKIFGNKTQRVIRIDDRFIYTQWINRQTPTRAADRQYPIEWATHFEEIIE